METSEFLTKAHIQIPNDPWDRLTPIAQKLIKEPSSVIDVHAHIFDKKCLSIGYILLRMLKSFTLESLGIESAESQFKEMKFVTQNEEEDL